jgi:shikimate kinase
MGEQLFFVGYMGSGKTTTAQQLSVRAGKEMLDMDAELERRSGCTVAELFARLGEAEFRQREAALLREIAGSDAFPIVACGGGVPCSSENMKVMKSHGTVIWLNVPFDELLHRLQSDSGKRPLLASMGTPLIPERLRAHWTQRLQCYEASDAVVKSVTAEVLEAWARQLG